MKITDKEIRKAIELLKESDRAYENKNSAFIMNPNKRVLSKRYIGKGRPKNSDYDYVRDEEMLDALRSAGYTISDYDYD